jgi:radical SAM-linked protein
VNFQKRGPVRFASHRDVVRIIQRSVAAAGIPVSFSRGYHPHMRMSFGPPLKTGWEGYDEYLDIHVESPVERLAERCNAFTPEGLSVVGCAEAGPAAPKLANDVSAASYEVRIRCDELEELAGAEVEALLRRKEEIMRRLGGDPKFDEHTPRVVSVFAETGGGDLRIGYTSTMHSGRVVAPQRVVATFVDADDLPTPVRVARTAQYVTRNGEYLSPLDEGVLQGTI